MQNKLGPKVRVGVNLVLGLVVVVACRSQVYNYTYGDSEVIIVPYPCQLMFVAIL